MSKYSRSEIIKLVKENEVNFIRMQFTDILGQPKNVALTDSQLEKALDGEIMFDGSSIDGFVRIEESDMYLRPDYDSFVIFPWDGEEGRVARLICDIYQPDGSPFKGDPRYVLKRNLAEAKALGFDFFVGPECEFFLFKKDEKACPTTIPTDSASYFDINPTDGGSAIRREICLILEEMGFEIEASHHENSEGQHEIDFKYDDALSTADKVMTFKLVVKSIASKHGMHATFMPKPIFGINGSGMHINQSLVKDGQNAFVDEKDNLGLSSTAYAYIAGLLEHARAFTAITNPLVNSYKRLVPGYEAPVYLAWSARNRSPLIRVPASRGAGTRVELRSPDPACNPYLAFATILAAGMDGVKRNLQAPPSVERNIYAMDRAEREAFGIESLPGSLNRAIRALADDPLIKDSLGEHIFDFYVKNKRAEYEAYRTRVHQWELDSYLAKY